MDTTKKVIRWMIEMKSLREELRDELNPWLADMVIEIFEKRIDSLRPNYDKIMSLNTSRGQVEYIEGFTDCIKIFKEMLK